MDHVRFDPCHPYNFNAECCLNMYATAHDKAEKRYMKQC